MLLTTPLTLFPVLSVLRRFAGFSLPPSLDQTESESPASAAYRPRSKSLQSSSSGSAAAAAAAAAAPTEILKPITMPKKIEF
jgi:hypothetical protein